MIFLLSVVLSVYFFRELELIAHQNKAAGIGSLYFAGFAGSCALTIVMPPIMKATKN